MMNPFLKACLDLCRIGNLPTVWTNVLAALVLSGIGFSWQAYLLLVFSLSLFYCGGMCLNDICDLAVDRLTRPDRPIPSGRLSLQQAWGLTLFQFMPAMLLLFLAPDRRGVVAGGILLLFIAAYDLWHKGNPLSVILMASCRLMVFVVTALALTGQVNRLVLLAACVQFAYVLVISLTARFENSHPDAFNFPVIPYMLAGISLLDGLLLAILASPAWLVAGVAGTVLTRLGQRKVRGD